MDVLSDQLPYINAGIVTLFKQYNYILNEDKVKHYNLIYSTIFRIIISVLKPQLRELLHDIVSDRLIERSKEELEILEMYSRRTTALCALYKGYE